MKKLFALFLTAVFLIGIITSFNAQAAEFSVYSTTQFLNKVKTQGRTAVVDNTLMLDWSASGIEFNADCSGDVLITVNTSRIKGGTKGGLYFTVIVDGVVQYENKRVPEDNNGSSWTSNSTGYPFHITKTGESIFTIARNLSKGKHNFKIYNQTEAHHGTFGIESISLNGKFTAPPKNNDLYIEFVGDSIIAGLGNISKGGQNQEDPLYQDATRGWAYLTANKLMADWSVVARSGITAGNGFGWSGAASVSMQKVYPKERYYSDEILPYAFERQPDVIVLGLGTNDMWTYSNYGATINDVKIGFKDILDLIRNHNPQSKIVWVYGMMTNSANDLVKQAVSDLGGSEKGYYTLELPTNTYGGQGHPDINAQTVYAEKVSKYINQLLNRNITADNLSSNISSDTVTSDLQQNSTNSTNPSGNVSSGTNSHINESNADKNNSVDNANQEITNEPLQKNVLLSHLSVSGYKLSPHFNPDVVNYSVSIPYDLTEVEINYESDSNISEVEILGNKDLTVGKNSVVEVICGGEDGEKKIYSIELKRLPKEQKNIFLLFIIIGIILITAIVFVLVIIRLKKREKKNQLSL